MDSCDNEKILHALENNKNCCRRLCFGPTGPTGPIGITPTILVRNTITSDPGTNAQIIDNQIGTEHHMDFIIPAGPTCRLYKSSK